MKVSVIYYGFVMIAVRTYGEVLRRQREIAGMTLEAVEARSGIRAAYIGRIERGEIEPKISTLGIIANALGLKVSDLALEVEAQEEVA